MFLCDCHYTEAQEERMRAEAEAHKNEGARYLFGERLLWDEWFVRDVAAKTFRMSRVKANLEVVFGANGSVFHCPLFGGECHLFLNYPPLDSGSELVSGIFVAMHHAVYIFFYLEREIGSKFPKESYHSGLEVQLFFVAHISSFLPGCSVVCLLMLSNMTGFFEL